jgi:glycosyltransferase involved in cell wall biosynthesis
MRILDVSPRLVYPMMSGAPVRTHNLLRRLAQRHEVRMFWQPRLGEAGSPDGGYRRIANPSRLAGAVAEAGWRAWPAAPILAGAATRVSRPGELDDLIAWANVVMVEFPWQFEYCRRRASGTPMVLCTHNVELEKFASWARAAGTRLSRPWLRYVERSEGAAVRAADLVIAVKDGDRDGFVRRYAADPGRVTVVPNGADTHRYRPAGSARRKEAKGQLGLGVTPVAIYVGTFQPANRVGLEWVRRLARRRKDINFVVVGQVGGEAATEGNLTTTGPVDDVRPWLEAADLALCPIEHGGGTKIKLLEALAAGLPVVAFPASVDGLQVCNGEQLLICDPSEEALAAAVGRLRDDPELAVRLGESARALMTASHDWERLGDRLEAVLCRLCEGEKRGWLDHY